MRRVLKHSQDFLDSLQYSAEALMNHYIVGMPFGKKHNADPDRLDAATYAYLYAMGSKGMLECQPGDDVTPVRLNNKYKQQPHYQSDDDAKVAYEHTSRRLKNHDQHTVYYGLTEGLKKLHAADPKSRLERELAGYMGVISFKIGVVMQDMELAKCAIGSIEGTANKVTKARLYRELENDEMLDTYRNFQKFFAQETDRGKGIG